MNRSNSINIALAMAAAGRFAISSIAPVLAADTATIKCENSSACKGKGASKNVSNAC